MHKRVTEARTSPPENELEAATAMPISALHHPDTLEACVRTALELGEITPFLQAQVDQIAAQPNLSDRHLTILRVLADAIEDGCIRRVSVSEE
jgi:hypothetical protein